MANSGARPNSASSSFPFERLPRYSEASSWPDYARCLTRESCTCPIRNFEIPANRARWFSLLYSKRSRPLCQTSLWGTEAGLKLPGQLHPPHRAEQPPYRHRRCAASERYLHLSRLPAWLTSQEFNPLRLRVHPALQLAYPASGTGAYPTLRDSGQ